MKRGNNLLNRPATPCVFTKARAWPARRFRNDAAVVSILFTLIMALWLPRLNGPIDLRWDAGVYYVLGTSLAEGKGYKLLNEPGNIDATEYPPLLPGIVAAHQWLLGTSDPIIVGHWMRLSFFLVFIVYIFIIYLMTRHYLPLKYAFLATVISLFNLRTCFLSDLCSPEIMYGITTALCVFYHRDKNRQIYPVLAAFFALASYATRTIGIALLAAWVGESLFNRECKRAAVRLMLSLIPILCWQSYISYVESGQQYNNPVYEYQRADYLFYNVSYAKNMWLKDPFRPELGHASFEDMTYRFLQNLTEIAANLGETISAPKRLWVAQWAWLKEGLALHLPTPWPAYFAPIFLGGLILGGIGLQLASRQWIIPLYILMYLAGICLTPWPEQFLRYMAPLTPFLALSLFKFLLAVKDQSYKLLHVKWKVAGLVFLSSIVFLILIQQSLALFLLYTKSYQKVVYDDQDGKKVEYRLFFYSAPYQALDVGLDWLKKQAKPGDVVAATMPQWVYLRTGLKTVMPPFEANPVRAQHLLDSVPVRYIILDEVEVEGNFTRKYASPLVQNSPEWWKRVYSVPVVTETGVRESERRFEIYQRVEPKIPFSIRTQ
jgi:hypothetical protein